MNNNSIYSSELSDLLEGFIAEKRSLGYKYQKEEIIMRQFDSYWKAHGYNEKNLTIENLSEWTTKKDTEGAINLKRRIATTRQFAIYLNGIGIVSYIPSEKIHCETKVRRPLSPQEITELFEAVDNYNPVHNCTLANKRIAKEYPVLFRLLYLNGLRVSEACKLPIDQLNLEEGTIIILDSKGNKDRLVYLADDMIDLLREYIAFLSFTLNETPKWLFPGEQPYKPLHKGSVEHRFNESWNMTSFAKGSLEKPVVHDLRHTFVVDRINKWMLQGLDFEYMLPYLSKYLGHKTFDETYYYYHYTEEAAKAIKTKDSTIKKVIPEVMRR